MGSGWFVLFSSRFSQSAAWWHPLCSRSVRRFAASAFGHSQADFSFCPHPAALALWTPSCRWSRWALGTAAPPHGHRRPFRSALCTSAHAAFPSLARCVMARCLPGGCGRGVPADPTPWEWDGGSPAPPSQHLAKKKPCCAAPGVQGRGRGVPGEEEEAATAQGALWDPGWSLAPAWCGCYQHWAQRAQLLVLAGKCLHKGRQCLLV